MDKNGLFDIETNLKAATAFLDDVQREQLPFALALSLTNTAWDGKRKLVSELPDKFIIRSPWVAKGLRIDNATKTEPTATIYTKDEFMLPQQEGGEKIGHLKFPGIEGEWSAIPLAARDPKTKRMTRANWPDALLDKPNHFIVIPKSIGKPVLFKKTKKKKGQPEKLTAMYLMAHKVNIEKRWNFEEVMRLMMATKWAENFTAAMDKAVATARRKIGIR